MNPFVRTSLDTAVVDSAALDAVRLRRAELRESLDRTEAALAAPAVAALQWGEAVHYALSGLVDEFAAHVEITEGPGGLHDAIVAGDLRLVAAVTALTTEHGVIATELAALVAVTAQPVGAGEVDALRERAVRLLGHLVRHRQRGADLVYEAFATDIGGAD